MKIKEFHELIKDFSLQTQVILAGIYNNGTLNKASLPTLKTKTITSVRPLDAGRKVVDMQTRRTYYEMKSTTTVLQEVLISDISKFPIDLNTLHRMSLPEENKEREEKYKAFYKKTYPDPDTPVTE